MAQNHKESSQYFDTPLVDNSYLDIARIRPLLPDVTDQDYTVPPKFANRPDLLAFELYDNPNLWWVFQLLNMDKLVDPQNDLVEGLVIRIATADRVFGELL